jgi:hypothetical protein
MPEVDIPMIGAVIRVILGIGVICASIVLVMFDLDYFLSIPQRVFVRFGEGLLFGIGILLTVGMPIEGLIFSCLIYIPMALLIALAGVPNSIRERQRLRELQHKVEEAHSRGYSEAAIRRLEGEIAHRQPGQRRSRDDEWY